MSRSTTRVPQRADSARRMAGTFLPETGRFGIRWRDNRPRVTVARKRVNRKRRLRVRDANLGLESYRRRHPDLLRSRPPEYVHRQWKALLAAGAAGTGRDRDQHAHLREQVDVVALPGIGRQVEGLAGRIEPGGHEHVEGIVNVAGAEAKGC